jgi:hypothetical protein
MLMLCAEHTLERISNTISSPSRQPLQRVLAK